MLRLPWSHGAIASLLAILLLALVDLRGVESTCPNSWRTLKIDSKTQTCVRLYLSGPKKTFSDAETYCKNQGGYLYRDTTQTVHNQVAKYVRDAKKATHHYNTMWIGLTDMNQDNGPWRWVDGNPLGSYKVFARGYRNTKGKQDCFYVYQGITSMTWRMTNRCTSKKTFICQRDYNAGTLPPTSAPMFCPKSWVRYQSTCIRLYIYPLLSWKDARTFCKKSNGDLVIITDKNMNSFITGQAKRHKGRYWIGLNDMKIEKYFVWLDQTSKAKYVPWGPHEPDNRVRNSVDEDCAETTNKGQWLDNTCGRRERFICQRPASKTTTPTKKPTPKPASQTCTRGWTLHLPSKTCIYTSSSSMSWTSARSYCKKHHSDLLRITDSKMNSVVAGLARKKGTYWFWIGFNDIRNEGRWVWLDDKTVSSYKHWKRNEPNNRGRGGEDCAQTNNAGYWIDNGCTEKFHFFCQAPASTRVTRKPTTKVPASVQCGAGWEEDPTSSYCFQFNTDRKIWTDARTQCKKNNGDLASIITPPQQSYITGRLRAMSGTFFWTGGNDRSSEQGWSWSDGQPFPFFNWDQKQPNNKKSKDCIATLRTSGRWSVLPCGDKYGYICKKVGKNKPTTPKPTTPPKITPKNTMWGCPSHWSSFRGSCYQIHHASQSFTWDQAKSACHQSGGSLAAITDAEENRFIFSLMGYVPRSLVKKKFMWIGLTDATREGNFYWYDATPMTFTLWDRKQPDNKKNQDCGQMTPHGGRWNDYYCGAKNVKLSVCKRNKLFVDITTPEAAKGCREHMLGYEAKCYGYYSGPFNFKSAQATCKYNGGNLATLDNSFVQAFVASELINFPDDLPYFWIGLSRTPDTNNQYAWTSGSTNIGNPLWSRNHTGLEQNTCVALQATKPPGVWYNFPCTAKMSYICEVKRTGGYTTSAPITTIPVSLSCPTGWYKYKNMCYKAFFQGRSTWPDARDYCNDLGSGGTLVTIASEDLSDSLRTVIGPQNSSFNFFWIGLNDRGTEGAYEWLDETPYFWNNFIANPTDDQHRDDCVQWQVTANSWSDAYCYTVAPFICQLPGGTPLNTPQTLPTIGPSGGYCGNASWTLFNKECYFTSTGDGPMSTVSWFSARDICQQMGSTLASIPSADVNGYVTGILPYNVDQSFWIGLTDLNEYKYTWVDGTPYWYNSWGQFGSNDDKGNDRCVTIGHDGIWNTDNCQQVNGYVCKKVPGNSPIPPTTPQKTFAGSCPRGFVSHPAVDRCYFVSSDSDQVDWNTATTQCSNAWYGARLASIHSGWAQDLVTTLLDRTSGPVWIGMGPQKAWLDNENMDYTNLGPDTDASSGGQTKLCVALNQGPNFGEWVRRDCTETHAYLCEYKRDVHTKDNVPYTTGCKPNYQRHRDSCYKYVAHPYKWTHAEGLCEIEGGSLMSVTDKYESAVLDLLTETSGTSELWIGLHYSRTDKVYRWSDGWPVSYTNFGPMGRNMSDIKGCVSYSRDLLWQDVSCSQVKGFICEINLALAPTKSTTVISCATGWTKYNNVCYFMENQYTKSAAAAEYDCGLRGGHLASVHSQTEALYIGQLSQAANPAAWIGLSKTSDGNFIWTDNSPMEFRDFWAPNEPSDTEGKEHQDCVMAVPGGRWADTDCGDQLPYICRRDLTTPTLFPPSSGGSTGSAIVSGNTNYVGPSDRPVTSKNLPGTHKSVTSSNLPGTAPGASKGPTGAAQKSSADSSSGMGGGAVAGIVLGIIVIVAVAIVGAYFFRRHFQGQGRLASASTVAFDNVAYSNDKKIDFGATDA